MDRKPIFVMARNAQDFNTARSMYPDRLGGAKHLNNAEQLMGARGATVYKYGLHWDHPNYREIEERVKLTMSKVVYL